MSETQLSRRERQIMDVIYARGESTVTAVLESMPDPPVRGALRTMLKILEQKGHLTHRREGREFVYRPTQPAGRAGKSALGRVLDVFFAGSLEQAVAAHLADPGRGRKPSADELRRLSKLIAQARKEGN